MERVEARAVHERQSQARLRLGEAGGVTGPGVYTVTRSSYRRGMGSPLSERLAAGIAAQDQAAIAACFADDVQFRALVPPGCGSGAGPQRQAPSSQRGSATRPSSTWSRR